MQNKTIFDLPVGITNEISRHLPTRDLLNVVETSKGGMKLFKTNQFSMQTIEIRKFLHHVVRGHHTAVAEMLKNPEFMLKRGLVTDLSGRIFPNISGFEYALWALNKHMWTKMLSCLPENKEGEKIKAELRAHYQKLKELGVTYTLHGVTRTEKHFDFEGTIFKELQEYVNKKDNNQWATGVGRAQRLLPMHVVYEYCSDTPFYPVPDFKGQPKSSTQFTNWWRNAEKELWFCKDSKLGIKFAIYKSLWSISSAPAIVKIPEFTARLDLDALQGLYNERTNDFLALEDELRPDILRGNQYKN
jgi:hypothetical protein